MFDRESIGQQLKSFREKRNLSQNALSFKCGLKRNQIIAIEKGQTNYTIGNFLKYLQGLGVNELVAKVNNGEHVKKRGLSELIDRSDSVKIESSPGEMPNKI